MDRGAWWGTVYGVAESDKAEQLTHTHAQLYMSFSDGASDKELT